MKEVYGVPVGYSDHSTGTTLVMLAVAAGATAIEKHVTFNESRTGYDHSISYGFLKFRNMVKTI
jgi:sialic acid synthase SpsE